MPYPLRTPDGALIKRDQVWRTERVQSTLHDTRNGHERDSTRLARRAQSLRSQPAHGAQLQALVNCIVALEHHAQVGGLDARTLERLFATAQSILRENKVSSKSRLAFLHGELHDAVAKAASRDGRGWVAAWEHELGRSHRRGLSQTQDQLLNDMRSMVDSGAQDAITNLLAAEIPGTPDAALAQLRLARVRMLRLTGALDEAETVLATVDTTEPSDRVEAAWERATLQALRSGSLDAQARLLRESKQNRIDRRLFVLHAWSHATRSKAWLRACPRSATLRRRLGRTPSITAALDVMRAIERCYTGADSVAQRLQRLGACLDQLSKCQDVELRLLLWSAATRWLIRIKRPRLAALSLGRYAALCTALSAGRSRDIYGLFLDVELPTVTDVSSFEQQWQKSDATAPTGRRRLLASGRLLSALARTHAQALGPRVFRRVRPEDAHTRVVEMAEILSHFMAHMKGPLMKVGQLLSFYGFELPTEARDVLSELHADAEPIPFAQVQRTIERELAHPMSHLFDDFDPRPVGAGSIGQVHRGRLPDGRAVAVKVQYASARATVDADIRAFGMLRPLLSLAMPQWDAAGMLRELGDRMLEECDFTREATQQRQLRELVGTLPNVVVPDVVASHSSRMVLTTEYFDGDSFADFCVNATQAERDEAGRTFARFIVKTTVLERWFSSDMHPGNLLFGDGQVCVVDFGNVRRWHGCQGRGWDTILRALLADDVQLFRKAFIGLGMVDDNAPFDFDWAFSLLANGVLAGCLRPGASKVDLDDVRREVQIWFDEHPDISKVRLPPEYVYGFRAYWGFFAIMAGLGASIEWRELLSSMLSGADRA